MKEPDLRDAERRKFILEGLGLTGGLVLVSSSLFSACEFTEFKSPNEPVGGNLVLDTTTSPYSVLAQPGGAVAVAGVVVIRISPDQASALSRICTHQGCDLDPNDNGSIVGDRLRCGCHGSEFNTGNGEVLKGPARVGLKSYPVEIRENVLTVIME
ncbi:MAG: Rieske (2Fe-2S) protein [Chlorobi bacterium]|nr:Rieske (2Fe-2S) protein [Chlorobiota bacterium]